MLSEGRIQDTLIIIFKCLNNTAPEYLKDILCQGQYQELERYILGRFFAMLCTDR